jgi:hypothetical protein
LCNWIGKLCFGLVGTRRVLMLQATKPKRD